MRPDPAEEIVDEVDVDGHVLRQVTRRQMRAARLRHRSVFIVVRSTDARVLVHRRSDRKDVWPGWWDIAVGGVVASGEDWDAAARREVGEEIGIEASPTPIDAGVAAPYDDDSVSLLARCYEIRHDGPFHFADGEITEARFVDRDELLHLLATSPVLPDSQALLARHLGL